MKTVEATVAREVRRMTRVEVMKRIECNKLTMTQGALMLGIGVRQLRRLRRRYDAQGEDGLMDGRAGRRTGRGLDAAVVQKMLGLRRGRYAELSMRHCHDMFVCEHGLQVSYSAMRRVFQRAHLAPVVPRRGQYRRRRPRQPMVGMRLHIDGSTHRWLGPEHPMTDLVIVLDDADGRLLSARLVAQEGTHSTLRGIKDVLTRWGRFGELYMDRGSHHYPYDGVTEHQLTRVLKTLSIRPIYAHSPQARGRCERCFRTLQGRLPQELALAGIRDIEAANAYLTSTFIDTFNARFTVIPEQSGSAFTAIPPTVDLELTLSIQQSRRVRNDQTVHHHRRVLQLPRASAVRPKTTVTVHTFTEGSLGISSHGRLLATFDADGTPKQAIGASADPGGQRVFHEFPPAYPSAFPVWEGGHL